MIMWRRVPGKSTVRGVLLRAVVLGCAFAPVVASAETMSGALARAYLHNPNLNQQRAAVRGLDENVPKLRSGWLPKLSATGYAGPSYLYQRDAPPPQSSLTYNLEAAYEVSNALTFGQKYRSFPRGYGLTATQTLFDGFATLNNVRQMESQVFQGREDLRSIEQDVLLGAASTYMDVLRDTAILGLRANNIEVLKEQVKQTQARIPIGQATETDIAQAEAALAQGRSDYFAARGALQTSMATFRQLVGVEPRALQPAKSVEALLPKRLDLAVDIGQREHPVIASALHAADAASLGVKVAESALYPTASITGAVSRDLDAQGMGGAKSFSAAIFGQINVPIYQGGTEYASIRQAKEQFGQARLMAELQRNQVRANVVTAWGQLQAAKSQVMSTQSAVTAAGIALIGIRSEAFAGQRTTFDILTAQQALLMARVAQVTAQRNRVVASYAILAAMGRLTAFDLGIAAQIYDPTQHFDQVKGRLFGTDGP